MSTAYKPASDLYQGTELQRTPGIPDGRMRAFDLPSRRGRWLHYPNGRRVLFPVPAAPADVFQPLRKAA